MQDAADHGADSQPFEGFSKNRMPKKTKAISATDNMAGAKEGRKK